MRRFWRLLKSLPERVEPVWRIHRADGAIAAIRLREPMVLAAFLVVLIWYIARPSSIAVLATVALGGMLAAGYFWARRMALSLAGKRHLNYAAVQVGDEIEETVSLTNYSAFPCLWMEFNDHSNIPGYSLTSVRAADGNTSQEWRAHAVCRLRGNYRFGPWEMLTGDPFGLFIVSIAYNQQEEILVYPPLAGLPAEMLPRGRMQGDDRPLPQPLAAESLSAFSTRPYAPGDPLRRIHWPTTARHDAPFVKLFDPEASSTLWLIPDLDSGVQRGEGSNSTLETMIILLASLSDRLLNERMAVGIIAYAQEPAVVLPARGRPHLWELLRLLAGLQPTPRPFADTLAQARTVISGRQRVVVVTPSLQPAWAGELQRLGAASRRSSAEVILLDPHSFGPPARAPGQAEMTANEADKAGAFVSFLASLGIPAHVLRQGDIQPYTASYGELSRWEFKTLGTGRAIARHAPRARAALLFAGQAGFQPKPPPTGPAGNETP